MIKTLLAGAIIMGTTMTANAMDKVTDTWLVKESQHDVATTTDKLVQAIEGAGATLFAEMDPATLVIFGNPNLGTPLMKSNPKAGLDLPIRVLIWHENGKTQLGALSPDAFKERYALEGVEGPLDKMNGALNTLMGKAAE
jgi:uncharacterized protein (DUF302 family)